MLRRTAFRRRAALSVLAGTALTATLLAGGPTAGAAPAPEAGAPGTADRAFAAAAAEYEVPRDLLVAVGYGESRLDDHGGGPSQANGYGVMHLVSNPHHRTLERAVALTGLPRTALREETPANIRGAAAVLRDEADRLGLDAAERDDVDAWYPAVARYGGAKDPATARFYADAVYGFLSDGLTARADGTTVTVAPRKVSPERGRYATARAGIAAPDYPSAHWVPAHSGNYSSGRSSSISAVVVHVTQGSYAGSISWMQNPDSNVSSHYVIRSSDGDITQMVRESDTAYHARSGNPYSVGIEHEGWVDQPSWFTDAMYRASAALTKNIADKYGIPKNRSHIVGHSEVPGNDHTDPGPHWDWNYYMELVGGDPGDPGGVNLDYASYQTLANGSSGPQVKAAQHLLNTSGHDAGTVDGAFGANTERAVRAFQQARGLSVDGKVGPRTWTALLSAGTKTTVRQGSSGEPVSRLQRALTAALGRTVGIDGAFGPNTATAVRDYQSSRGLGVDGIVGPATWTALQAGK
jgi:N-acetyl-anhydromuramyl-L-alanine amidase AmpD